jgi:hypothetical protein
MRLKMNRMVFVIIAVALTGTSVEAACPDDLVQLHNGYVAQYKAQMQNEAASGDAYTYYALSYFLQGMISAIECTRDESELQFVISLIDKMISTARDYTGDGFVEWLPLLGDNKVPYQNGTWQAMSPMARAAAFILNDSVFRAKYGASAQRWITFVHNDTINRWYKRTYGEKIPYVEYAPSRCWSDKVTHFLTNMVHLYTATGNTYYREIALRGGNAFKTNYLKTNGRGWLWSDGTCTFSGNYGLVPDTSHANREPMWMVAMYEAGILFTASDVTRMGYTMADIIWDQSLSAPRFANYINGSNVNFLGATAWQNGNVYSGWVLTGRYNSKAQSASRAMFDAVRAGISTAASPSVGINSSSYGKVALTGHLIRNSMVSLPDPIVDTIPPLVTIVSPVNGAVVKR